MSFAINAKRFELSKRISLIYGLILFVAMFFTGILTTTGVYYLFFHQAERALEISADEIITKTPRSFDSETFPKIYIPSSVILRVTDDAGEKFLDTAPSFFKTEEFLRFVRENPPFWANKNYTLIETADSIFYYKELPLKIEGETFHFQLFTNITFEKHYIRYLLMILFAINLIGLAMAVTVGGFFIQRRLLSRIEENFNRQQQFILDAAHEFKTPITVIRGYSEMLEIVGAGNPDLVQEAAASINNSSQDMQTLVENMLFLANADQGNLPLNKIPLEINPLLRDVIETFKNPRIEFDAESELEINGDYDALRKMFAALIDNALIYSEGKVTVTIENSAVKIIDSGIGIAPENIKRIFDRFFRVDKSRTKIDGKKTSFGLGLSVAKWIADNHGIKISVDSEIGKGSTFTLTIPH